MKVVARLRAFFLKQEADKEVLDQKRFMGVMILILAVGTVVVFFSNASGDSSVVVNANTPIETGNLEVASVSVSQEISGLLQASEQRVHAPKLRAKPKPKPERTVKIKYKAPQIIERQGADSFTSKLPIGSNLIGKLLTSIDTRESGQLYRVLLPYGGKGQHGGVPKNTVLFGTVNYPKQGMKVFMQFAKALLPNGQEVALQAQALSTQDYAPGLVGELHSGTTARVAATLGLTMVAAFTDTLTTKQALSAEGAVTPQATTKNALYQGIAKASETEAQRQAAELGQVQPYVTIPAGREMIVNLLETYKGEQ